MITATDNYVFFAQNVLNEHMQTMVVYLRKLMKHSDKILCWKYQ